MINKKNYLIIQRSPCNGRVKERGTVAQLQLKVIKAELLCYGLRLDATAFVKISNQNPYALERTLVHAMHIVINDMVVNVCVAEEFCKCSPYYLTYNQDFILWKGSKEVCTVKIVDCPSWCNEKISGYKIGDYLRPHSDTCVSCSPILKCGYQEIGKTCRFCSLNEYASQGNVEEKIAPQILAKMIFKAMMHKKYELNFSSGTMLTEDKSANYYIEVLQELRELNLKKFPYISIEITPPDKDFYIQDLADMGVTALIMNIEIIDEKLRRIICPGKSEVTIKRYIEAMQSAVHILGIGNVSSVLLAGIQPAEDIINMGRKLIEIGVIPTIMPFKPLDDCAMKKEKITNPNELLFISERLENQMVRRGLNSRSQYGCTKCGGCSLETVAFV